MLINVNLKRGKKQKNSQVDIGDIEFSNHVAIVDKIKEQFPGWKWQGYCLPPEASCMSCDNHAEIEFGPGYRCKLDLEMHTGRCSEHS